MSKHLPEQNKSKTRQPVIYLRGAGRRIAERQRRTDLSRAECVKCTNFFFVLTPQPLPLDLSENS